ncbi:PIN domain-containing protein [Candidatus Woesearchaeota archaeon]|nr:PIN domain-containing protein [Candidatus Woesearchaeota archaeon]
MSFDFIVDSSAWADYFGGSEAGIAIQKILEEKSLGTSILAIAELADKYGREGRPFTGRLDFIKSKAAILPLTVPIALEASKLKMKIRSAHQKFGLIDALHLATAKNNSSMLLATDNDFKGVEGAFVL